MLLLNGNDLLQIESAAFSGLSNLRVLISAELDSRPSTLRAAISAISRNFESCYRASIPWCSTTRHFRRSRWSGGDVVQLGASPDGSLTTWRWSNVGC